MKKYRVRVIETSLGDIYVEANNEDEAMELAEEMYANGKVDWDDTVADLVVEEE